MNLKKIALSACMASLLASPMAVMSAQQGQAALNVSITINGKCDGLVPTNLDFGTYPALPSLKIDATSTLTLTCTPVGLPVKIGMNDGVNVTGTQRRMANGTNHINYALFKDASYATHWHDGESNSMGTYGFTATTTAEVINIYGRVPGGQTAAAVGTYTDTVTMTLYY